ncbi:MAG TPA: methyltransferase domain-containing protein [Acidobacteriota bacterium]|nr:methyltransferase domain-containing protein [Acidobacteriota bacterium]
MDQTKEHYSYRIYADPSVARTFDQKRFGGSIGEYVKWVQENVVFYELPDVKGWKIADIGAGTGRLTIPLLERGAKVTACDASKHMLEVLKKKSNNPDLETYEVDAHSLPFKDQTFQCSLSFRMIFHVIDWKKALREICRISNDWVIIDFAPKRGFLRLAPIWHSIKKLGSRNIQSYQTFDPDEVFKELRLNGFEVVYIDSGFFLPIAAYRLLHSRHLMHALERIFSVLRFTKHFGSPITVFARRSR